MDKEIFMDGEPLELLRCALCNLEGLGKIAPVLVTQPIYQLTMAQLGAGVALLEKERI